LEEKFCRLTFTLLTFMKSDQLRPKMRKFIHGWLWFTLDESPKSNNANTCHCVVLRNEQQELLQIPVWILILLLCLKVTYYGFYMARRPHATDDSKCIQSSSVMQKTVYYTGVISDHFSGHHQTCIPEPMKERLQIIDRP